MLDANTAPMPETRLGQHIVSVAEDTNSQLDLLADTFGAALCHECRCLFIADHMPSAEFVDHLARRGCDLSGALETGQFQRLTSDQTYTQGGHFDPDRMLGLWCDAIESARADGFAGLCASGDISWPWQGVPGVDRWLEYEHSLNLLEDRDHAAIICLYDARRVSPGLAHELLKSHPFIHQNGGVETSPQFVSDWGGSADVPLVEELEPPADQLPCEILREILSAYTDHELLSRRSAELERHLAVCKRCAAIVEGHSQLKHALAAARRPAQVPGGFWDQVSNRLKSTDSEAE